MTWITPCHEREDFGETLTFADKVLIFEEQVTGWLLDIADACMNSTIPCVRQAMRHAGFAVLLMVFSYFEMIAKYKEGYTRDLSHKEIRSAEYFRKGVQDVFSDIMSDWDKKNTEDTLTILFRAGRCGFYHSGVAHMRIAISHTYPVLAYDSRSQRVLVNPHRLVPHLKEHVRKYTRALRGAPEGSQLRSSFLARFDAVSGFDPLR